MLVGAQCRDLLHWRYGGGQPLRSTNDTDIAVALRDWGQFAKLRERFPAMGDSGHRFLIGGIPTDVIPFGDIEAPPGTSAHPPGTDQINVHGFADAFQRADALPVSAGASIRIPHPAGYAVLKMHAWLDRSKFHEYKDGPDLAVSAYWHALDLERLYDEDNHWALDLHDFDVPRAAAALLGRTMRTSLGADEAAVLASRIVSADRDLLAQHFGVGVASWPRTGPARRPIVDALLDQFMLDDVH